MTHMSRRRSRLGAYAAWIVIALFVGCQSDRILDAHRRGGDHPRDPVPTVAFRHPLGFGSSDETSFTCDPFEVRLEGDDGTGSDAGIAGYQLKLVEIPAGHLPYLTEAVQYLTGETGCLRNLLLADSVIVDDAEPVTDSTFHACDWFPKPDDLHTDPLFPVAGLMSTREYLLAARAFDTDGNVMPPEAYAFASLTSDGNIVKLLPGTPTWAPPEWALWVHEENFSDFGGTLYPGDGQPQTTTIAAGLPLLVSWHGTRAACGPAAAIEYAYALDIPDPDCSDCIAQDGVGGWTPWGADSIALPGPLVFDDDAVGETHTLHIRVRDEGFDPGAEPYVELRFDIYGGEGERPALWIDDFVRSGVDDCEHDAIIRPWLDAAVRPYIRAQEGIALWPAHPSQGIPCFEQTFPVPPSLDELLRFRMLFWNVAPGAQGSALGAITVHPHEWPTEDRDTLVRYVEAGGGFVVWGVGTIGAMLGDDYNDFSAHIPSFPEFPAATFGPGTFLWDVMKLRTTFDWVGRGTSRRLSQACSGLVGLEATPTAIAEGYPVGTLDPTGYSTDPSNTTVTPRTAIWFDGWQGRQSPFGTIADAPIGSPPLHVAGMDTLYTFISNSWSYLEDGPNAIRDACGTSFLSSFEGKPIVIRYESEHFGRVVWIGADLAQFAQMNSPDIQLLMERLIAWVLEGV